VSFIALARAQSEHDHDHEICTVWLCHRLFFIRLFQHDVTYVSLTCFSSNARMFDQFVAFSQPKPTTLELR
jgi:hypothetical protein